MERYTLPFADIKILDDRTAEVIVNDGIEFTASMVERFHDFLLAHLRPPLSLLINRIHSYTYDFEAQQTIGTIPQISSLAILVYSRAGEFTTNCLFSVPRVYTPKYRIFKDRAEALFWLKAQVAKSTVTNLLNVPQLR